MKQKIVLSMFVLIGLSVCAWSPWIMRDRASHLAESQFNRAWNGVIDGCGTSRNDLGPKEFRKVPFGAYVTLDYQCGLVMPDEPALHTDVFVSFFGVAFGFPKP
jgi:hypothetical protein